MPKKQVSVSGDRSHQLIERHDFILIALWPSLRSFGIERFQPASNYPDGVGRCRGARDGLPAVGQPIVDDQKVSIIQPADLGVGS